MRHRTLTTTLIAGVALVAGAAGGWLSRSTAPQIAVPVIPAHASATMGAENFAVATGLVDEGVEAFYFLDFLTGKLKATVINRRDAGFAAYFEYDITQDFDGAGRSPKYLMVTGIANIPRGKGNTQLARSVVYITDATSGQMSAYVMPWNSSRQAAGNAQVATFYKIGTVPLRADTFVRDQ
ncbi:hypothetical protein Pla123a_06830 [Posidoniimonas polymericola]|uniref:Uncharacterized protein n=1 Tax=Posidoniimonas polymericola TaxID=2528002 RepID=A0A5C5ZFA7_9BACT|nr:hypothetical protein [Posidoniimonas polymericola]TWT85876.1 hypothetical protein Pla123a_06830 [Posidoniimonas polymericola]